MAEPARKRTSRDRRRLRAAGLRPIEIWIPDTRAQHLAEEARRQSLLAARHKSEKETLDFIEAVADLDAEL